MIQAHCDDEVIFGWPIIQEVGKHEVYLLTLAYNEKYPKAGLALDEVCKANKINLLTSSRENTNFYRLPPRYSDLTLPHIITKFNSNIEKAIIMTEPDYIFTHNPMGEYGHGDHRFVFNMVSMFDTPLMLTDICFSNHCHLSSNTTPDIYEDFFYSATTIQEFCRLNVDWYNRMKLIYEKHKAWSWGGHNAVTECNLYTFY
jgi:hypothetical protein